MSEGGSIMRRETIVPLGDRGTGRLDRVRAGEGIAEYLVFQLGPERMGLPLGSVREILKLTVPTAVPRAPHDVLGILSVRGRITTVLDLRRRLGMPDGVPTRFARVLLVEGGDEVMGLLVDEVLHVVRLRPDEIEAAGVVGADLPEHVAGLGRPRREAARGVGKDVKADPADGAEVLVLLDPGPLLKRG